MVNQLKHMNEINDWLGLFGGRSGRAAEAVTWLFATGAVLKLFNARLQHWLTGLVAYTVQDPADDRFMEGLLGSRAYRFTAFLLDLAFRLKFPNLADYQARMAARGNRPPTEGSGPSQGKPGAAALALLAALGLGLALAGCQATPNRIAYNTVATTTATVNAAVQGWWDYKTQFPGRVDAGTDAKVRTAYEQYQATMKVILDAYTAGGGWPGGTNNPTLQGVLANSLANAAQEETDLLNLIAALKAATAPQPAVSPAGKGN